MGREPVIRISGRRHDWIRRVARFIKDTKRAEPLMCDQSRTFRRAVACSACSVVVIAGA
jgi:hypothetical protein